jgi:cytochrome P450
VAELTAPIPINVIAQFTGVPRADWAQFRQWSDEIVSGTYPALHRNERGEGLAGAHPEFAQYLDDLIAARIDRDDAPDDLVSRLLQADIDGRRLTPVEVRTQIAFIILAGNETTRQLLGNLLVRVATDRNLFERLRADRSLIERAVEESLRIDPPFPMLIRNVEQPTDVFGPEMCPGEKIVFGLASANRDEATYDAPDRFDLTRPNWREHVAFGAGPHVCPGASLARLEAQVLLDTLLDRVETISTEPGWVARKTPVFFANGPIDLPVRVVAASR